MKDLWLKGDVRSLVVAHVQDYQVDSVTLLGEGLDNVAFLVNDELIVRFNKEPDHELRAVRVQREASVLACVAGVVPVSVPEPRFVVADQGCLAYFKIPGVPLRTLPGQQRSAQAPAIGAVLGRVLSAVHAIPAPDLIETDDQPLAEWLREAEELYRRVVAHVPSRHRRAVEAFFAASAPDDGYTLVFTHNDLGIEHVLVDPGTCAVTGIIDWSDAARADPAYDFGLLYRDLGARALEAAVGSYRTGSNDLERLRQRAVFYARCSVFEDLAYGLEVRDDSYLNNGLAALEWLFAVVANTYE